MAWDDPLGDLRRFIAACEDRYRNPLPPPPTGPDLATWEMNRRFKQAAEAGPRKLNRAERRAKRKAG